MNSPEPNSCTALIPKFLHWTSNSPKRKVVALTVCYILTFRNLL